MEAEITKSGGKVNKSLPLMKGFAAEITPKQIQEIAAREEVRHISLDSTVEALLDVATQTLGVPEQWSLGNTGKGRVVAIVDSGIYPHPDLSQPNNRIIAFKDFINGKKLPYDDFGHGTHVAGIIAGNGYMSNGQYKGVAPEASIVGVKVLNQYGVGKVSNVIAGIQWVVKNKNTYAIDVLNLSLGAIATESWTTDPLSQAAQKAWEAGMIVVAAAGNDGPNPGTIRTPSINPNIITVGALDDQGTPDPNDDVIAGFSSQGPTIDGFAKPDRYAPGVNITSLLADTTYVPKEKGGSGGTPSLKIVALGNSSKTTTSQYYNTMSGTSLATALISGEVALLLN
ncbi:MULTISPECIES: S8 family serine peptidase [Carboxydocella]|uniref:S8 family serine peptidase n=1 Tax=Carboxydocella TaxID=178898 RepID=UPI001177C325|nr:MULTISPECIES: S8 family serine peptidase [Carboxydocella]